MPVYTKHYVDEFSSASDTPGGIGQVRICPGSGRIPWRDSGIWAQFISSSTVIILACRKGKMWVYAMKVVAAGAHLPTPWVFALAKRPDDRADCRMAGPS